MKSSIEKALKNKRLSIGNVNPNHTDEDIAQRLAATFRLSRKMYKIISSPPSNGPKIFFLDFFTVEQMIMVYDKRDHFRQTEGWNILVPFTVLKVLKSYDRNGQFQNFLYIKSSDLIDLHK